MPCARRGVLELPHHSFYYTLVQCHDYMQSMWLRCIPSVSRKPGIPVVKRVLCSLWNVPATTRRRAHCVMPVAAVSFCLLRWQPTAARSRADPSTSASSPLLVLSAHCCHVETMEQPGCSRNSLRSCAEHWQPPNFLSNHEFVTGTEVIPCAR